MLGVNFTYSIQTAASDVDVENARHRTESDSDDGCPAESPEMVFSQAEMLNEADGDNTPGNKDIYKIISQCLKMQRNFKVDVLLKFWHSSQLYQSMWSSKPCISHMGSVKNHASILVLQSPNAWVKAHTSPNKFATTRNAFFITTIFPSQRPESQVVQKVYWAMKVYFMLSKSTLPHRNLDPSPHFSSANMSAL